MYRGAHDQPLRIENVTLVDGTGAGPLHEAVIQVEAARIVYAGPADGAPPNLGRVEVMDGAGGTVLPGFIDCHVHFGIESASKLLTRFLDDPTVATFKAAERMRLTLDAGITTARDLGGLPSGFRVAGAAGLLTGPRLHTAVRVLSHTGGHGDLTAPGGFDPTNGMAELVDTVDEVRIGVRRLLREGADVIKVCATGGMGSPHDQPDDEGLTTEEIQAVVDEVARHGGRPVAAHAQGTAGILNAIRGGVTSVEHGYGINDEAIDLAGEKGVFLVPTLSTVFDGIDKATMQPYHYEKKLRWANITRENISHAIERGIKIALGTDAAVAPHGQNLRELEHLVNLGMRPADAIVAGTRTAAELLGLADELGTLQAGKIADLIVCAGDPLADITLLGKPENVIAVVQAGFVRKNTTPTI
jgi:imidazolonepropionase-like amidohydrolase